MEGTANAGGDATLSNTIGMGDVSFPTNGGTGSGDQFDSIDVYLPTFQKYMKQLKKQMNKIGKTGTGRGKGDFQD